MRLNTPSTPSTVASTLKASSKSFSPNAKAQQLASSVARDANKEADRTNATMSFTSGVNVEASPKGGLMSIKEESVDDEMSPAPAGSNVDKPTPEKKPAVRASENASGKSLTTAVFRSTTRHDLEWWWPLYCQCWGNDQCENCSIALRCRLFLIQHDAESDLTEAGVDYENLLPFSTESLEREYMLKAAEYVTSFPSDVGPTAEIIKSVTTQLHRPYAPSAVLEPDVVQVLKARYVDAVVTFLGEYNKDKKPVTKDQIGEILANCDGNFLYLCAVLADLEYISIENLDQVRSFQIHLVSY